MCDFLRNLFGKKKVNVSIIEEGIRDLKVGSHIVFRNLPDIIYERLIGKDVDISSLSFEVTAVIEYDEDGYPWTEYTLEDQGIECSLEVVKDFQKLDLKLWILLDDLEQSQIVGSDGKPNKSIDFDSLNIYSFDIIIPPLFIHEKKIRSFSSCSL